MTHNVDQLRKIILHDEFVTAQEIREACKEQSFNLATGFAVAYRAGLIDGRKSGKDNLKKAFRDLAAAQERITVLEGVCANFERLLTLLSHPEPDRDIEALVQEIDAAAAETAQTETPDDEKSLADLIAENDK